MVVQRERWEEIERNILAPWACRSAESAGRLREEEPCPLRTAFQRDRDRIVHSKAFRRLKHKTQVFLSPEGDHYRTRLTHTLEVAQIARTISRALSLNEDLTEAIALGHDLGHTPFGHMGERVLDKLAREEGLPGFQHAMQSHRIVTVLEKEGKGLNLTREVRDGILHHSKGQVDVREGFTSGAPSTFEGWVVRLSDSIAYLNHDLDDALRGGVIAAAELPSEISRCLGNSHGKRIGTLIEDVVQHSGEQGICMSDGALRVVESLRAFLYERVYMAERALAEEPKVERVLRAIASEMAAKQKEVEAGGADSRHILDFMSGMSDRYALELFERLCVPFPWPREGVLSWKARTV